MDLRFWSDYISYVKYSEVFLEVEKYFTFRKNSSQMMYVESIKDILMDERY